MSTSQLSKTIDSISIVIVSTLLNEDRRMIVREIEGVSNTLKTMIYHILTKYLMKKKVAVQWYLTCCLPHKNMYRTVSETFDSLPKEGIVFLQRVITIDETWMRDFELELKSQSEVWRGKNSPRLQKYRHQASKVKQMMIMAYDYTGVTATYAGPYGHTVAQHVYVHVFHKISRPKV